MAIASAHVVKNYESFPPLSDQSRGPGNDSKGCISKNFVTGERFIPFYFIRAVADASTSSDTLWLILLRSLDFRLEISTFLAAECFRIAESVLIMSLK